MYIIEKDTDMNVIRLGSIIAQFMTTDLPKLQQSYNYYKGNQPIMMKQAVDVGRPNNKICVNYCRSITDTYSGYLGGIPISYSSDENIENLMDILRYNDYHNEDNNFLRQALIFGKAFEVCYIDEDKKQRFKTISPLECIDIYDDTLNQNLKYIIRFYKDDLAGQLSDDYFVDVYDDTNIYHYKSSMGFSTFTLLGQQPHYYKQVPFSIFYLNEEQESIFYPIRTLQDAYNTLISSETDSFESWADAYLILKGITADEDDLIDAKRKRAFMIDSDADVSYLTKNVSDTQIENMLLNLDKQIHKISNAPNFSDEHFNTASGISLRYKLLGFENVSANIESNMKKALQKRIELLAEILELVDSEKVWRDIDIVFTRNLPIDLNETVNVINGLKDLVSDETLLTLLPFVKDPEKELQKIEEQRKKESENNPLTKFTNDYLISQNVEG